MTSKNNALDPAISAIEADAVDDADSKMAVRLSEPLGIGAAATLQRCINRLGANNAAFNVFTRCLVTEYVSLLMENVPPAHHKEALDGVASMVTTFSAKLAGGQTLAGMFKDEGG